MIWSWVVAAAAIQTTLELDAEAGRQFLAADKSLNLIYQRLLPKLNPESRGKLAAAQIKWIKYRDAWAEVRLDAYRGGTFAKVAYTHSRAATTENRVKDFTDLIAQMRAARRVGEGVNDQVAAVDQRLNANYKELLESLDAPGKKILTTGELAWMAYRDAELGFTDAWRHDAAWHANRLYELTQAQAEELKDTRQP